MSGHEVKSEVGFSIDMLSSMRIKVMSDHEVKSEVGFCINMVSSMRI